MSNQLFRDSDDSGSIVVSGKNEAPSMNPQNQITEEEKNFESSGRFFTSHAGFHPMRLGQIFRRKALASASSVSEVYFDQRLSDETLCFYVVIEDESLEVRNKMFQIQRELESLAPSLELDTRVILRESDPELDQLPATAVEVSPGIGVRRAPQ